MARGDKLLAAMRENPRDWTIDDIRAVCRSHDLVLTAPKRGSHYKVRRAGSGATLTIPAHKPINEVYIRLLIAFVEDKASRR